VLALSATFPTRAFILPASAPCASFHPEALRPRSPQRLVGKHSENIFRNHPAGALLAGGGGSSSGLSEVGGGSVDQRKQAVLKAVAKGSKDDVLRAARVLEETGVVDATQIGGRWSLVFSTQTDISAGADGSVPESVFNQINAVLYRFFFRFAPFLAGAEDRAASPTLPGVTTRNEQVVDLAGMTVDNKVELQPSRGGPKARIRVVGELEGSNAASLAVTFTSFSVALSTGGSGGFLPALSIPLPRPVGRLVTTFCDGDMRLSRGGRGGIFVLKRLDEIES